MVRRSSSMLWRNFGSLPFQPLAYAAPVDAIVSISLDNRVGSGPMLGAPKRLRLTRTHYFFGLGLQCLIITAEDEASLVLARIYYFFSRVLPITDKSRPTLDGIPFPSLRYEKKSSF